jgi:N-acetylmuramoyl-L-alanine amidase
VRALKRLLALGVPAGAAATMLWAVAPALSLTPYAPEAVDFEQRVPSVARVEGPQRLRTAAAHHAEEGPVRFRSGVIDAPARFDLVGIGGELRPVEYRARASDGKWSEWVETANGDPVYFGGADELQLRSRGARPDGTLHYVNVSGSQTLASRVLTGAREAVNSALISVASVTPAAAEPAQPDIVSRKSWADGGCRPRGRPAYGEVEAATIHHTVTANSYSRSEAPGIVLGICRFHRNGNGWNDIGYNFLVDRFGDVYAGRSGGILKAVVGAHAQGFNSQTTGVASLGTHTSDPITDAAKDAFVDVIAWKLALHGTKAGGKTRLVSSGGSHSKFPSGKKVRVKRVFGHRRVGLTACPGGKLKKAVKRIARRAQDRIENSGVDDGTDDGGVPSS